MSVSAQVEGTRARILIVEDEGLIARDIKGTLEKLGYFVVGTAATSSDALSIVNRTATDLVLMDICLQGKADGIATAERIRTEHDLPVVYLTAHADSATIDRATTTEPFGYIVKPFTTGDIKASVEIALQRHRLQAQITRRESSVTAVLRSIGDAVIVTNADDEVTFLNAMAEDLLGVKAGQIQGAALASVLSLRSDSPFSTTTGQCHSNSITFSTGTLLRPDGTERLVISSIAPVQDPESERSGSVIVLRDISDLRKAEQALRETNWFLTRSNDRLNQLSHSLSHDLQEPLRNINTASELLLRRHEANLSGSGQEYLSWIKEGCTRMSDMLSSLLAYYRSSGSDSLTPMLVDAAGPFEESLHNLRVAIQTSGASIQHGTLPSVYAHPVALLQIFQNLIGNAVKYGGRDTLSITVSAKHEGSFYRFTVADNGQGFPPSQASEIFELFKRAHGRNIAGSGIGLAMCRRLVEQYGGRIWAESTPGDGASFHFTVPAERTQSEQRFHTREAFNVVNPLRQ